MPSSYTTSLRFELQFTGENVNLWGDKLNAALSRVDDSVAGWAAVPLTGDLALATANGTADQARLAMLKFTGTGAFTVTVPAVSKRYDVWNACTGVLTVTNGSASVAVQPGEVVGLVGDGGADLARVQPTDFGGRMLTNVGQVSGLSAPTAAGQAATKAYVDAAVAQASFTAGAFGVPVMPGDAGRVLTNDGSTPGWAALSVADIGDYAADQAARAAALDGAAQAHADAARAQATAQAAALAVAFAAAF